MGGSRIAMKSQPRAASYARRRTSRIDASDRRLRLVRPSLASLARAKDSLTIGLARSRRPHLANLGAEHAVTIISLRPRRGGVRRQRFHVDATATDADVDLARRYGDRRAAQREAARDVGHGDGPAHEDQLHADGWDHRDDRE